MKSTLWGRSSRPNQCVLQYHIGVYNRDFTTPCIKQGSGLGTVRWMSNVLDTSPYHLDICYMMDPRDPDDDQSANRRHGAPSDFGPERRLLFTPLLRLYLIVITRVKGALGLVLISLYLLLCLARELIIWNRSRRATGQPSVDGPVGGGTTTYLGLDCPYGR